MGTFCGGTKRQFKNKQLSDIGIKYKKTPAQVILRWLYQNNIVAIPKSIHPERIKENFTIDDFTLSLDDMQKIEAMDIGKSLILNIQSHEEVQRLHNIRFEQ